MSRAAASAWFTDIPSDAVDRIRAATLPPSLVIALIRDCGHYPWVEQPATFSHVLHDWLGRVRLSDPS